jgi:hypothetical protein
MPTQEQFVVDSNGKKTGAILPLKRYQRLMGDLHDLAVVAERRAEITGLYMGSIRTPQTLLNLKRNDIRRRAHSLHLGSTLMTCCHKVYQAFGYVIHYLVGNTINCFRL